MPEDPTGHEEVQEDRLRELLAAKAEQAPEGGPLADRIMDSLHDEQVGRGRRWRRWGVPATAAACVAAVAGLVLGISVATNNHSHTAAGHSDQQRSGVASVPSEDQRNSGLAVPSDGGHSEDRNNGSRSQTGSHKNTQASHSSAGQSVPTGFQVTDLSFDQPSSGWALGTTGCADGQCGYLVRNTSIGGGWRQVAPLSMPVASGVGDGCGQTCVDHVRFVSASTGYLYGPQVTYVTTDGGKNWAQQSSGALSIEADDSSAVRITGQGTGSYGISYSTPGNTAWSSAALPGGDPAGTSAVLARTHAHVYLLVGGLAGGGAELYSSTDSGASWSGPVTGLCPDGSGEVTSAATDVTGNRVVYTCAAASGAQTPVYYLDSDATTPTAAGTVDLGGQPPLLAVGAQGNALLAGSSVLRSDAAMTSWSSVDGLPGGAGATYLGFENQDVVRYVSSDRTTVWTSTDGGQDWSQTPLG